MPEGLLIIDIVAAIAIVYGLVKGIFNGIIKEVAGLVAVVFGIWAGFRFAFIFADYYKENTELPENVIPFIAFATAFAVVMALVLLGGRLLKFILEKAELNEIDRAAGAAFGTLKWAFIIGTVISLVGKANLVSEETKQNSITYPILTTYCEVVTEYTIGLIPTVKNVFTEIDDYFKSLPGESEEGNVEENDAEDESQNEEGGT